MIYQGFCKLISVKANQSVYIIRNILNKKKEKKRDLKVFVMSVLTYDTELWTFNKEDKRYSKEKSDIFLTCDKRFQWEHFHDYIGRQLGGKT